MMFSTFGTGARGDMATVAESESERRWYREWEDGASFVGEPPGVSLFAEGLATYAYK
jgi:hypothetical protein